MMTLCRKQKASKQNQAQYLDRNPNFPCLPHLPRQLPPSKMPAKANCHIPVNFPKFHQNRTTEMSQIRKSLLVPHQITIGTGVRAVSGFLRPVRASPVKG